jgi:hypothetical protein
MLLLAGDIDLESHMYARKFIILQVECLVPILEMFMAEFMSFHQNETIPEGILDEEK